MRDETPTLILPNDGNGDDAALRVPAAIGPYRIVRPLGSGSMGAVYLAVQQKPVRRQVALKVVHRGELDEAVRLRFSYERQAVALLSHPNVAALFDAGDTPEGDPFFVMEYVAGPTLLEFCDAGRLTLDARLELFGELCRAVHYVHSRGVLHRDLKPSNVLVAEVDGRPLVKVVDFGVARLAGADDSATSLALGTPDYMSPEALGGDRSPMELDARTDVYALGVILHELLVGRRPHARSGRSFAELRAALATETPQPPSRLLAALPRAERGEILVRRRATFRTLMRRLRDDLDWIAVRAVAREPETRYASAGELATEIEREGRHEPLASRPTRLGYTLRKLAQRRRGLVTAVLAVVVALLVGLGASLVELGRERAARRLADAEAARVRESSEKLQIALAESRELAGILVDVLGNSADNGTAEHLSAAVERGARALRDNPPADRARYATLLQTLGELNRQLGRPEIAEALLNESLDESRSSGGERGATAASSLRGLAAIARDRGRIDDAIALHLRALTALESASASSADLAAALADYGALLRSAGRRDEADAVDRRIAQLRADSVPAR